jgi:hypothetical protein
MLPFSLDIELRENVEIERMMTELKKPTKNKNVMVIVFKRLLQNKWWKKLKMK